MRVVHINVRLNEGGAARVALDLHRRLQKAGFDSQYFYGYSSNAKPSKYEESVKGAVHLANRNCVMLNYATHRMFGLEFCHPFGKKADLLKRTIQNADVVHLHAIHSYFMPFGWLSNVLKEAKKIVWTCHDFWPITGRCAFLEGCYGWKGGCGSCRTNLNYPPSFFDFSAYTFKKKREQILRHLDRIVFAAPSNFVCAQFKEAFPLARVETIYNGIDAELEEAVLANIVNRQKSNFTHATRVLVMANDLADPTKIDRSLVEEVISIPGVVLHTIGRNSPFHQDAVVNHGEIRKRTELVNIMNGMHALLFTSMKDTFGLVMIEAMVCGVPVLALSSDASNEVLGLVGQSSLNRGKIIEILSNTAGSGNYLRELKMQLSDRILRIFSGQEMFSQYLELYK